MTTPKKLESAIESAACKKARLRGWLVYKFVSPAQRGVPDRMFIKKGRILWIEFKAPGEEPTSLQEIKMREMIDAGAEVHWVDNVEAALEILR